MTPHARYRAATGGEKRAACPPNQSIDRRTQVTLTTFAELWDGLRQRDLRQRLYDAGGVVMKDALLDLHGDAHKLRRRVENRLFRRGTFRWWESELVPQIIDEAFAPSLRAGPRRPRPARATAPR